MKQLRTEQLAEIPAWPGIIDSHIHWDSQSFEPDLGDCLKRAQSAGVAQMLIPSLDVQSSQRIVDLVAAHPTLRGALGIHPHQAASFEPEESRREWQRLLPLSPWVAIGETGLECHYDFCPLDLQIQSLEAQIELAQNQRLPLILHCRQAEQPLYDILSTYSDLEGVVHCFTGDWPWAKKFLDRGFYLGFGGLVTLPKAHDIHEVASKVPADRWLLETDGPYLAPVPFRGYRNESCLLPLVIEQLTRLRHQPEDELVAQSSANARKLFRL